MDSEYQFWYGVKVWKQLDFFGTEASIDLVQDGGHIILKETKKFLCGQKKETVMKKMGVEKEKVVDKRIENTTPCKKCQSEWVARNSIRRKIPMAISYETKTSKEAVPGVKRPIVGGVQS